MSDSLERLYDAVVAARDLDPAASRTAKLLRHGSAKAAKKMAEEAIEVVIDVVSDDKDAIIRESADLLYNLSVVWVSTGIRPEEVWAEMDRRERLLGIAEKIPKPAKIHQAASIAPAVPVAPADDADRRPIVTLDNTLLRKHS
jgi:phosphoribosyl-ATP pyrophosphohydrolase